MILVEKMKIFGQNNWCWWRVMAGS